LENIFHLLLLYKYIILFPLAIVEGPILAVIAGFLCIQGYLNIFICYPIIVFGDIVGDSLCYSLGRWGVPNFVKKITKIIGFNFNNIEKVKTYFDTNPNKTISLSKILLGIGIAGIYIAGNVRIPYFRFIRICVITSALQYIFYLGIGLLFGNAYQQISHYLDFFAAFTIVVTLAFLVLFMIQSIRKKL